MSGNEGGRRNNRDLNNHSNEDVKIGSLALCCYKKHKQKLWKF